ncbi:MAG: hypothetical protein A2Z12_03725 [Actinobacteria bacterium RBG_16_68_21]|nr:MAG: hypothetical protein A2Z12_03725 [Actinobacteria bacterium RBG_16_68_21]
MRRLALVLVVVAMAVFAALLSPPDPPPEPLAGLIIDRPGIESPIDAAIWYCPWAQSDTDRDSFLAVASLAPATADFTLPVAIPGEPPDQAQAVTSGPGASGITLSDIAQRGDSPGFIEFSNGPSAASVMVTGDVVAADDCVATGPDEWFFAGGSTMTGERLVLRLFNPFPETAKVSVTGFSEIGVEALGDLRSVSVNPRSWRDIPFEELLRQRQTLVISVRAEEGLAIPAMSWTSGTDEALWMGTDLSTTWEFPVLRDADLETSSIVVANPSINDVDVTVDLFTEEGAQRGAFSFTIPALSPLRIGLGEVDAAAIGALVTASAPVAASVVAVGTAGTAATAGSPDQAVQWLLPGVRSAGSNTASLWLLNSGDESVSVTISALTGGETRNSKEILEPGTIKRITVERSGVFGYMVTSMDRFSAAWSISGPRGIAFAAGIPVPVTVDAGTPGGTDLPGSDG